MITITDSDSKFIVKVWEEYYQEFHIECFSSSSSSFFNDSLSEEEIEQIMEDVNEDNCNCGTRFLSQGEISSYYIQKEDDWLNDRNTFCEIISLCLTDTLFLSEEYSEEFDDFADKLYNGKLTIISDDDEVVPFLVADEFLDKHDLENKEQIRASIVEAAEQFLNHYDEEEHYFDERNKLFSKKAFLEAVEKCNVIKAESILLNYFDNKDDELVSKIIAPYKKCYDKIPGME